MRGIRTTDRTVSDISFAYRDKRLDLHSASLILLGSRWDLHCDPKFELRANPVTRLLRDILERGLRDAGFGYAPLQSQKTMSDRCYVEFHDPLGPQRCDKERRDTNFFIILIKRGRSVNLSVGYEVNDDEYAEDVEDFMEFPKHLQSAKRKRVRRCA